MTVRELSDTIDTKLNAFALQAQFGNATTIPSIEVDEYEKSLALTSAQKEFIIDLYTGKTGPSYEEKELTREALDALVKTYETNEPVNLGDHFRDGRHTFTFYAIPDDLLWIVVENVQFAENSCICVSQKYADVIPVQHDELLRTLKNPFRGPRTTRVLRLNAANNIVELVSDYPIGSYMCRYIEEPHPIILVDLTDGLTIDGEDEAMGSVLPDFLHEELTDRAVVNILKSKSLIPSQTNTKTT